MIILCPCTKFKITFLSSSQLLMQTVSLDPALTPLVYVTGALGVKWTQPSSYPVIYFSFPVWLVTLFCMVLFSKGLEADLNAAHTVESLDQMGPIFPKDVQWLLIIADIKPLHRTLALAWESGDWRLLPQCLRKFIPHWMDILVALEQISCSTMDAIWRQLYHDQDWYFVFLTITNLCLTFP